MHSCYSYSRCRNRALNNSCMSFFFFFAIFIFHFCGYVWHVKNPFKSGFCGRSAFTLASLWPFPGVRKQACLSQSPAAAFGNHEKRFTSLGLGHCGTTLAPMWKHLRLKLIYINIHIHTQINIYINALSLAFLHLGCAPGEGRRQAEQTASGSIMNIAALWTHRRRLFFRRLPMPISQ